VATGRVVKERRSILDLATTICFLLGVEPPTGSVGRVLEEALEKGR
jgi:hypothetical protein